MKVYISGKISGLPYEQVKEKFEQAVKQVAAYEYSPVSPLDNGCSECDPWGKQMKECIGQLLDCDAIYLLWDWKDSKGARIEEYIAREQGLQIMYQPEFAKYTSRT